MTDVTGAVPKEAPAQQLSGHLRLPGAIALAITIVVGSGALVLPGIVYANVGNSAIIAWVAAGAVTVPLLAIFATLGSRYPGAGGVAGFVQHAFGRKAASATEIMLMGTFGLGIPAIATTGGNYLCALLGLSPHKTLPMTLGLLLAAVGIVLAGVQLSSRVEVALAILLTVALVAVGLIALTRGDPGNHLPNLNVGSVWMGVSGIGLVYFAFTGWEMLSFTTEEYVNPRRDFPRVVAISFVVVLAMYLILAWGVQTQLKSEESITRTAPLQGVISAMGWPAASRVVALVGIVTILANLVGAVWGASRLVMSSAREGLLPRRIAVLNSQGNPIRAVLATSAILTLVVVANAAQWISLSSMLTVAGKNFFLIYLASALAYARLIPSRRLFGVAVALVLGVVAALTFGPIQLGYAAVLVAVGYGIACRRGRPSC